MKRNYCLLSITSLVIGIGIYVLFRNSEMLLFQWAPKLKFINSIYMPIEYSIISSMFLFNLSDALWFLSGILFIRYLWFYKIKEMLIYLLCFYLVGIIFEISQLSRNIPGTFDTLDLVFMSIAAFFEGLLYNFFVKRRFV